MPRSSRVRSAPCLHQLPWSAGLDALIGHTRTDPEREPPESRFSGAADDSPLPRRRRIRSPRCATARSDTPDSSSPSWASAATTSVAGSTSTARARWSTPRSTPGITLIDTADIYGDQGGSESLLGEVLEGRRDEIVLATKFGMDMDGANGPDWGARGSRRYIRLAVEASLRRLPHRLDRPVPVPRARRRHAARGDGRRARRARARGQGPVHRVVQPRGLAGRRRRLVRPRNRASPASSARRTATRSLDRTVERELTPGLRRARRRRSSRTSRSRTACSPASTGAARPRPTGTRMEDRLDSVRDRTFDRVEALETLRARARDHACSTSRSVGSPRSPPSAR